MRATALLITLTACFSFAMLARADSPKKMTDAEISKLLVGKWAAREDGPGPVRATGTIEYKKDGTVEMRATLAVGDQTQTITLSGTWKVSDGHLVATVTKTSAPDLLPKGHVSKDRVVSITDKLLTYQTEYGKESNRERVKD